MINTTDPNPKSTHSLVKLIGSLPGLLSQLVKDEVQQFTTELTSRLKKVGVGVGFFVAAAFFALVAFWVLVAAAILGLAVVVEPWLAALIVAVVFLVLAAVLAILGVRWVKRGLPPVPKESIDSIKEDVQAVKGVGKYDR